jgi:hypothetical protein
MSYKVKRFSSLTKETKTQEKNRKKLATSVGGLTALTGAVGTSAYDAYKGDIEMDRLINKFKKAAGNDLDRYKKIDDKIQKVSDNLMSKSNGLDDYNNILRGKFKAMDKNLEELGRRGNSSRKFLDRGGKLINKASDKRLAIGLGLSTAAGLGAAYGVNKILKNKNNKK